MTDFSSSPELQLDDHQLAGLAAEGVEQPNEVQLAAFGPVLAGEDVVVHAGTGTGKTLAYLLPVLQLLRLTPGLRAVVVAPGTELVMQIVRAARAVGPADIAVEAAASTTSRKRQKKRVVGSTRLIVGTPDRIGSLLDRRKLKGVRLLVLDELDPLLAAQASSFLERWLVRSEPRLQVVVATATLGPRSEAFLARFRPQATRLSPRAKPLTDAISHRMVRAGRLGKDVALARFVQQNRCRRAIVFVSDTRLQSHVARSLDEQGIAAVSVAREGSKQARRRGLQAFRDGEVPLLLTTDAIARGLDVPDVDWVLHYDLPQSPEAYVHRAGRTGRAGQTGSSVVFVDDRGHADALRIARALGLEWEQGDGGYPGSERS